MYNRFVLDFLDCFKQHPKELNTVVKVLPSLPKLVPSMNHVAGLRKLVFLPFQDARGGRVFVMEGDTKDVKQTFFRQGNNTLRGRDEIQVIKHWKNDQFVPVQEKNIDPAGFVIQRGIIVEIVSYSLNGKWVYDTATVCSGVKGKDMVTVNPFHLMLAKTLANVNV